MRWINEIDSARNTDELKSSASLFGRMIPGFVVLDSKIACALKKLLAADFKRRIYMEEQQAQQDNRFLKGRQIAYMIYDNFKISGIGEALHVFNDLSSVQLKNVNVQGFDTKWDEIPLSMTKFSLEIFQKTCTRSSTASSKNGNLSRFLNLQEKLQKRGAARYSRLTEMVRRYVEQNIRDKKKQCPQRRQIFSWRSSLERKPNVKSSRQCAGHDQRSQKCKL